ncbi:hypothetical protein LOTGIDRAFT_109903 [Lottia gigantea]|uniref:Amine oxidase n=1 Tax=Lottia gigantea TaxID=225164 RepID=V4AIV0_LOTGI|nr:hypothetical protein LOTGIDRAFT_109903 [Lottia gigantea]ESP04049.1 hypothetical protein LOTGIDRAFT_109903 [Lottia gigantea]
MSLCICFFFSDRVGGRTLTVPLKAANGEDHWDLGGQWVGRSQTHIMNLLQELGVETYKQYTNGTKFMQLGDVRPRTYQSDIPSLSILALLDLQNYIWKVEKLRKKVSIHDPWSCPKAVYWDSITLDTFIQQNTWTKGARDTIYAANRGVLGMEPSQFSFLFFLLYLDSADGLKNLTECTENAAQEFKIQGGAQQVSLKIADKIGKNKVKLNQPVTHVHQVKQIKELLTAYCYFSSLVGSILFEPMLPSSKLEIVRHFQKGNMMKIIITYKEAFWREQGYSGEVVSNGGSSIISDCETGPICLVFDATTHNNNPALVVFISGYQCVQYMDKTPEERQKSVLHQLSVFWGGSCLDFIDYTEQDWNKEPYIVGAPVCCLATGNMRYFVDGVRKPFQRIHFAGTESATQWCGYMSGAVQAGIRTAVEILQEIRPQSVTVDDLQQSGITYQRTVQYTLGSRKWFKLSAGLSGILILGFLLSKKWCFTLK